MVSGEGAAKRSAMCAAETSRNRSFLRHLLTASAAGLRLAAVVGALLTALCGRSAAARGAGSLSDSRSSAGSRSPSTSSVRTPRSRDGAPSPRTSSPWRWAAPRPRLGGHLSRHRHPHRRRGLRRPGSVVPQPDQCRGTLPRAQARRRAEPPAADPAVNKVWMSAGLLAGALSVMLQSMTGLDRRASAPAGPGSRPCDTSCSPSPAG
jgi:hypothetical protein